MKTAYDSIPHYALGLVLELLAAPLNDNSTMFNGNIMKHKLLPTMIGTILAGGMGAAQADVTVFGHLDTAIVNHDTDPGFVNTAKFINPGNATSHVAGSSLSDNTDDTNFRCTTCSIGFKGSEDLGNGLKAIFYLDFQYDIFSRQTSSLLDRDQWLGLAGNFGQVRWGTISTPYKSHGAMIDPLYRTAAQGRDLGLQSQLHSNAGEDGQGRADHTVRWDSPSWNGFKVAAYYTLDSNERDGSGIVAGVCTAPANNPKCEEDDDAYGIGAQYTNGGILVFADYVTNGSVDLNNPNGDLSAWKVGGKYTINNFAVMGQYESIEPQFDLLPIAGILGSGNQEQDQWHLAGTWTMGNNMVYAGYGATDYSDILNTTPADDMDQTAYTIAGTHSLRKRTMIYAAYNHMEQDNDAAINAAVSAVQATPKIVSDPEQDVFAIGMKHKF
jgi:predicted porin